MRLHQAILLSLFVVLGRTIPRKFSLYHSIDSYEFKFKDEAPSFPMTYSSFPGMPALQVDFPPVGGLAAAATNMGL